MVLLRQDRPAIWCTAMTPWLLPLILFATPCLAATPAKPLDKLWIPVTPGLITGNNPIVVNKTAAIQLGKALFWDVNVGSDGVACATCHYHAGADSRSINQLNPGFLYKTSPTSSSFELTGSGELGGPDYSLTAKDFPLYRFADPANRDSEVIFKTDDVVGSAGVFLRQFQAVTPTADGHDACVPGKDSVFHLGSQSSRQVTPRNAPSVINAIFNYRNFWDGRANNLFNGVSAFGPRDKNAGVWIQQNGKVVKKRLLLENASLASLAVAPPLNDVEMSCAGRRFQDLARKLLSRKALENQEIHIDDSVLAGIRHPSGIGTTSSYQELIKKTFAKRFWAGEADFGISTTSAYPQMEVNFPFFFGLAIQLYEATLVSDQSRFDGKRDPDTAYPLSFSETEKRGLALFVSSECASCHAGPTFSAAAHPEVISGKKLAYKPLVNRTILFEELTGFGVAKSLIDVGFMITSVSPPEQDIGLGGQDPFGNPLSFVDQYVASLANPANPMPDAIKIVACEFGEPFAPYFTGPELRRDSFTKQCKGYKGYSKVPTPAAVQAEMVKPLHGRMMTDVAGAFKIPSLRNIELTGPYMHNGSMKSLEEVIEFYNRGGNNFHNPQHNETLVFPHGFSEQDKADLLAFLKTLTDERVRWEKAPFDHPSLTIVHGHNPGATGLGESFAADNILMLPAVGKNGRANSQGPLQAFEYRLQP